MTSSAQVSQRTGGITVILVLAVTGIVMTGLLSTSIIATNQLSQVRQLNEAEQTFFAAEAGLNQALYGVRTDTFQNFSLPINNVTVAVTTALDPLDPYGRIITSTATHPNGSVRTVQIGVVTDTFAVGSNFAVHAGAGGLRVSNQSEIRGDVFSNGSIVPTQASHRGTVLPDDSGTFPGNATVASAGNRIEQMVISGDAHAETLKGTNAKRVDVAGRAFYQTIDGAVFADATGSNEQCATGNMTTLCRAGTAAPNPEPLPISDTHIDGWSNDVQTAVNTAIASSTGQSLGSQTVNGSVTWPATKVSGNLTLSNNAVLTMTGPLWVTGDVITSNGSALHIRTNILFAGNVTFVNGSSLQVDASVGPNDIFIIANQKVDVINGTSITGSGNPKSALTIISRDGSLDENQPAIRAANNSTGVVYYALHGIIRVANTGRLNAVLAHTVYLENNAIVSFLPDLSFFTVPNPNPQPPSVVVGTWREL